MLPCLAIAVPRVAEEHEDRSLFFIGSSRLFVRMVAKQFSFTPETNAHVESRQISKPNLVLKSSYKQRPCEGIDILPSSVRFDLRIPRFSSVCTWISHKCTVYLNIKNIYTYINVHLRLYAFDFITLISAQLLFINYLFWSKSL